MYTDCALLMGERTSGVLTYLTYVPLDTGPHGYPLSILLARNLISEGLAPSGNGKGV